MAKGRGTPTKKKRKPPVAGDNAALAGELMGVYTRQILKLTREELRHWAGQKSVLSRQIGDVLHVPFKAQEAPKPDIAIPGPRSMRLPSLDELPSLSGEKWLEVWQRVYWEVTGIEPSFRDIIVPINPRGFGWVIAMTPEVPLNVFWRGPEGVAKGLKHKFNCWSVYGDDLEASLNWEREQRSYRNGAYAVRVCPWVEADEEHANRSALWHEERGTQVITLPERVLLEGCYWLVSGGKHLDVHNYTLCSGSRSRGGGVPRALWNSDAAQFRVYWFTVRNARPDIRAREVVS